MAYEHLTMHARQTNNVFPQWNSKKDFMFLVNFRKDKGGRYA